MQKALFISGLILIIVWAIGFIGFHLTGLFHILPVIAISALTIRIFYNTTLAGNVLKIGPH
jgi:hypothetical protein